ncbi:MAG: 1-acyl-sn-glycerol-3-phosphate acyltransferase [Spirochaetaceae bacterium]|nr:MAG: 1-acyl-sn-glycerol-3-phosphate acyltransferase [Spirochaetaceae bacterium]
MMHFLRKIRQVIHIWLKAFAFFCFGLGSLVIALHFLPLLRFFIHPAERFRRIIRNIIRTAFRTFVMLMKVLRLITVKVENYNILQEVEGMLICANHPSLIDVVILISLVPNADCIIKSKLWNNPIVRGIVRILYIPNSLDVEETINACRRTLEEGNNLIIFPEGTRTAEGQTRFQRSAAQIALRTGYNILPIRIIADSPIGLRKGDSLFCAPESGIVNYNLEVHKPLYTGHYIHEPVSIASRSLTNDLKLAIIPVKV